MDPNHKPAGSTPVNPLQEDLEDVKKTDTEPAATTDQDPNKQATPAPAAEQERIVQLEKMLNDSKSMIGKQSNEVGELRRELAELKAKQPQEPEGPTIDEQIDEISAKMESGELSLKEGNRQIAQLSAQLATQSTLSEISQRQQQEAQDRLQQQFMEQNPDFQEALDTGALAPYLEKDPLGDEYTAFIQFKNDQRVAEIQREADEKIAAAKEEGAKLAQGASAAGTVLGKSGTSAQAAAASPKPFKNSREASDAMMATLQKMRSGGA